MYLARIRRGPDAQAEVVAAVVSEDGQRRGLLPLAGVVGQPVSDPVAVVALFDLDDLEARLSAAINAPAAPDLLDEAAVHFEVPTPTCTKICCLALNYLDHANESNLRVPRRPALFFKPPTALTGHRTAVVSPARTTHVEHEIELAVVIGKRVRDLPKERWLEAVAGYSLINDVTARDLQLELMEDNVPWDQAKGFDTFAPVGPYLATVNEVPDPQMLDMTLVVDGTVRQRSNTSQMINRIPELIADLSAGMTLLPGDIIATGTISGVSPLGEHSEMVGTIDKVGTLVNSMVFEARTTVG